MRRSTGGIAAAVLAAVAVGGLTWWAVMGSADAGVRLRPDDPSIVASGQAVYAEHCASCHGAKLEGQGNWKVPGPDGRLPAPPHDETGHTWHHDDATLFALTKHGVAAMLVPHSDYQSNMPAYDGVLSDEEIVAVLSFIKSTWRTDVRERHDAINRRAGD